MKYSNYQFNNRRFPSNLQALELPLAIPPIVMGDIASPPLLWKETLYLATTEGLLKAVDEHSFEVKWTYSFGDAFSPLQVVAGQCVMNEDYFCINYNKQLFVLHPKTGKELLRLEGFYSTLRFAVIVKNRLIFSKTDDEDNQLSCISLKSGKEKWSHPLAISMSVLAANKKNVVLCDLLHCYCFAVKSGELKWQTSFEESKPGPFPILFDDQIILAERNHYISARSLKDGSLSWRTKISIKNPSNCMSLDPDGQYHLLSYTTYIRLNAQNGEIQEEQDIEDELDENEFYAPGNHLLTPTHLIVTSTTDGKVIALNRQSRAIDWQHTLNSRIPAAHVPLITEQGLHILTANNELHSFLRKS